MIFFCCSVDLVRSWSLTSLAVQQTMEKKKKSCQTRKRQQQGHVMTIDSFICSSKQNKTKQCVTSATVSITNDHPAGHVGSMMCVCVCIISLLASWRLHKEKLGVTGETRKTNSGAPPR